MTIGQAKLYATVTTATCLLVLWMHNFLFHVQNPKILLNISSAKFVFWCRSERVEAEQKDLFVDGGK